MPEVKEKSRTLENIHIGIVGNGFIVSQSFELEMSDGNRGWDEDRKVFTDKTKMLKAVDEILSKLE